MLVLILAVSHPAFSIEQKEKLRQIFETIKKEVHQVQQVPQAAAAAAPSAAPRYDTTVPYSPVYQENDCHFFDGISSSGTNSNKTYRDKK